VLSSFQSSFIPPAGGIADICTYSAWFRTGGFQYSRNIATPRIVAPLPFIPSYANTRARALADFMGYRFADPRITGEAAANRG